MPNTYTQIHIQVVFAVQNRISLIAPHWEKQLYKYMTAIIQNAGHKVLQINGVSDHVHILIGLRPKQSLSELMKRLKGDSSSWINKNRFCKGRFAWQEGYGAFSYAKSQVPHVIQYIANQEIHHRKKPFLEEYRELLKEYEIDFNEKYLFQEVL